MAESKLESKLELESELESELELESNKKLREEIMILKKDIVELTELLTNHINFVNNIYIKIQKPFHYIFDKIETAFYLKN